MSKSADLIECQEIVISLVMATYGRFEEPEAFIKSLLSVDYDLKKVELIIVDQNIDSPLKAMVDRYRQQIALVYVPCARRGLSLARNIGFKLCRGRFVGFPDDDCEYFFDTLQKVEQAFSDYPAAGGVIGAVKDHQGHDRLRRWPRRDKQLMPMNFYTKYSSVGLFVQRESEEIAPFCEQLGAGAYFGAAEDADYVYRLLQKRPVYFVPGIWIYHPDGGCPSEAKVQAYGRGFGGFCRKNWDLAIFLLFLAAICYHGLQWAIEVVRCRHDKAFYHRQCFFSRWQGFFIWRK